MKLTPAEKETQIMFNEAEEGASVETFSERVAQRLAKAGIGDMVEKSAIRVKVGKRSIRLAGQSKMKDPSKPMPDSAYETETFIWFDEESPDAEIYTSSLKVCKRLKKAGLTPDPHHRGQCPAYRRPVLHGPPCGPL